MVWSWVEGRFLFSQGRRDSALSNRRIVTAHPLRHITQTMAPGFSSLDRTVRSTENLNFYLLGLRFS